MKTIALALAMSLVAAGPILAGESASTNKPIAALTQTNTGQPILLPQGPLQVTVTEVNIAAGASLPVHRHPYQRYAYVLGGKLKVVNTETGAEQIFEPGGFIVEALGQWHYGTALGTEPVKLLVIDQGPKGAANVEIKPN